MQFRSLPGIGGLAAAVLLLAGCGQDPAREAYRQGLRALAREQYPRAARLLQQSLQAGGTNVPAARARNALGVAQFRLGRRAEARAAFEAAALLDPADPDPAYNLGVLLAGTGAEAQAAAAFQNAAALDPTDSRPLECLAALHLQVGRPEAARAAMADAYRRAPHHPRVLSALGVLELQATNVVKAISFFQEALEHDAHYPPAVFNLALINARWLKNDRQAEPLFREYLRLAPTGEGAALAAAALAEIDRAAGAATPDEAPDQQPAAPTPDARPRPPAPETPPAATPVPATPRADRPTVSAPAPEPPSCEEILRDAQTLERRGRADAAVNNYLRAARAADQTGRPRLRDQAERAAVRLAGDHPRAQFALGEYAAAAGRSPAALDHFKQAVALSNTWGEALLALAREAATQGEGDTAVVALKQAVALHPDAPDPLWALARLYDQTLILPHLAAPQYALFQTRFGADPRAAEARARFKALGGAPGATNAPPPAPLRWWRRFSAPAQP